MLLLLAGVVELTWGGGVLDIGARWVSVSPLKPQRLEESWVSDRRNFMDVPLYR